MVQEYKNIAIIGAGAAGCMCANFLLNHFDSNSFSKNNINKLTFRNI